MKKWLSALLTAALLITSFSLLSASAAETGAR